MEKVPTDLRKALSAKSKVKTIWESLTPIAQRDWISWIESAKQQETRKRRIEQTSSKLLAGKRRPCCYALVPLNFYQALGGTPNAKAGWSTLTATEKRDFVDWVGKAKEPSERDKRIMKACGLLSQGKRRP